jgi:hypothetical protein
MSTMNDLAKTNTSPEFKKSSSRIAQGVFQTVSSPRLGSWFDRQTDRESMQQSDGCNLGLVFLLLTIVLIVVIFVQV